MKKIILSILALAFIVTLNAQEIVDNADSTRSKPFQFSFIYPVGTYGVDSYKYSYDFSLNILSGVTGGVNMCELGAFANLTKGNVDGVQAAGFVNAVHGSVLGCQLAGFVNATKGSVLGLQGAGYVNVALDSVYGVQGSGFVNVAKGKVLGGQGSGFVNVTTEKLTGIQGSCFGNVAVGDVIGVQGTGFANAAVGDVTGVQGAGFANVATGDVQGVQGAGFLNVSCGSTMGVQGAGFANVSVDTVTGFQAAGFANYGKVVNGTQIGFLNICDTITGIPIGFLSLVRKGYHAVEIEADNYYYANLNVKLGVRRFYNIFSASYRPDSDDIKWGFGYGVGTLFHLGQKLDLNIDAMANHNHVGTDMIDKINMTTQLKLNLGYKITDNITVYGGGAYKLTIQDLEEESIFENPINSWSDDDVKLEDGFGFNAGLRFNF